MISSKLQLSESMAGVTVLAFGNGSPDLFSTFTAMNSGSGSLAIGELIGAAFFIVSVVSGCMGIIRPFQSKRITFMRDASFLTGAIMMMTWIVYHRRICWYHGLLLITYYLLYVIVVVMSTFRFPGTETPAVPESKSIHTVQDLLTETSRLLSQEDPQRKLQREYPSQEHLGHIIKPVSSNSSYLSRKSSFHSNYPRTRSNSGSISSHYRHPMSPRVGIRTSLFGAIDFQEQVSSIRRANSAQHLSIPAMVQRSSQSSVPCLSRPRTAIDFLSHPSAEGQHQQEDYFTFISSPPPNLDLPEIILDDNEIRQGQSEEQVSVIDKVSSSARVSWPSEICTVLFPTLKDWRTKTQFAKLNALIALPVVLILTLTLPVTEDIHVDDVEVLSDVPEVIINKSYLTEEYIVEEEQSEKTGWCRWLLVTQALCSMTFIACVMALNGFISPSYILIGFITGCFLACWVLYATKQNEPPEWYWMLSFGGFVIALNWIFLLANEMVGLLQALGSIFDISEAIMGLTIFALGNSVGDFVANTAIAKMGFPTMAISACYAGPLLNMVLGVGISSTYQTWITGKPYALDVAPTILISSCGLITVLLSTLVVVNINGYHINKSLGWWMIIIYSTCCIVNVLLEFRFLK
ncbi:hypothetical protein G6F47_005616 [Rhizopus delemar]|nr:hypothetical protein G6F54_003982 [Rhizopus delemar]KAG1562188.1 hypothetical protein G6F49_001126 [Rhizopus delemar]KAG1587005.1 hypothetical protein G6F48_006216 [Rhizopus delemar]KAG1599323.1 hypothetical protein G6F47_005616 [Rhizopus delemar]